VLLPPSSTVSVDDIGVSERSETGRSPRAFSAQPRHLQIVIRAPSAVGDELAPLVSVSTSGSPARRRSAAAKGAFGFGTSRTSAVRRDTLRHAFAGLAPRIKATSRAIRWVCRTHGLNYSMHQGFSVVRS
jgi:hypothetical protein